LLSIFPVGMAYLAAVGVQSPLQPTESDGVSVLSRDRALGRDFHLDYAMAEVALKLVPGSSRSA
jgi:hypothetical protein